MDDNFGEWVESMGVANGRGYQEAGVDSGWNLWVWLVSVVRRYIIDILIIIITFPTLLVLALFLAASSLFLCSFLKCFFVLVVCITKTYFSNTMIIRL